MAQGTPEAADEGGPVRRKWRGVEPDARTAERRERIIEAAIELLSTEGLGGTTVRAVCARTGLHSRYFYESFDSIAALLVAVFDLLSARFVDHITQAADAAGDDPRARVEAVMEACAEVFRQQTELVRILTIQAVGNEDLNQRRIQMLHRVSAMIEADAYRTYGRPPPGDRLAAVSARFMAGGLAELFVAWIDGELGGTVEDLARDGTDVLLALAEATATVGRDRARRTVRMARRES
ncbi:MAG TPA: TetR/AcrR family transcriptional regulator [Acidimicrobiales bacterium]|nr:TetR/AcrR family transcriptional regulator [Acidimicrobiales bacterium]